MSYVFILMVISLYFFECRWRLRTNRPLNKGKPIDGGQYIVLWMINILLLFIYIFFGAALNSTGVNEEIFKFSNPVFELIFSDIYKGFTASEPKIWQDSIPHLINYINEDRSLNAFEKLEEIKKIQSLASSEPRQDEEWMMSYIEYYRVILMLFTCTSLYFGRKFIYAPFFEMEKSPNTSINRLSLFLQIGALLIFWLFVIWLVFLLPIHNVSCPARALSFWCMDLSSKGPRYFAFPMLISFYWVIILLMGNASIQAILNELGFKRRNIEVVNK